MKIKVGFIFGGNSVEHEVSIISAVQAMKAIDKEKYEAVAIYITKEGYWYTGEILKDIETYKDMSMLKRFSKKIVLYKKDNEYILQKSSFPKRNVDIIDIAFPIVHGNNVEDGTVQGYLNLLGIPYVGSDIYGSAVGQDKVFMKQILSSVNIPITKYTWFFENSYHESKNEILKEINALKYPVIIKPARLGSSVGISIVKEKKDLEKCIEEALNYDFKIIVEEVVENLTEVNASVIGNYENSEVSVVEEVMGTNEFLTYKDKYLSGGKESKGMASTNRIIPARLDKKTTEEVQNLAKKTFKALNNSGVARIDFLIDKNESKVYVNEINTIPGSLSFYLWEKSNLKYTEMLTKLISNAIRYYKKQSKIINSFETNILSDFNGSKGAKNKL